MGGFDTVAFGVEALLMTKYLKRCDVWRTVGERTMIGCTKFFDMRRGMFSLMVDPELKEVWENAGEMGKKRVVIRPSDLSREFLESMLKAEGVKDWDGWFDRTEVENAGGGGQRMFFYFQCGNQGRNSRLQRRQDCDILCLTNATQCTYNK